MKNMHVVLVFLILLVLIAFFPDKPTYLPEGLNGLWITDHPDYADRTLDLSEITMVFATSDATVDVYFVDSVEKAMEGKNILYTVYFHRYDNEKERIRIGKNAKQSVLESYLPIHYFDKVRKLINEKDALSKKSRGKKNLPRPQKLYCLKRIAKPKNSDLSYCE